MLKWVACVAVLVGTALCVEGAIIQFDDFSSTAGLALNGDAAKVNTADGWVLQLHTGDPWMKKGSAYWETPVHVGVFNAAFRFRINSPDIGPTDPEGEQGADGFVFAVQASAAGANSLGEAGDNLGYKGVSPSVAVEFDIWKNVSDARNHDPSSNHLGILVNGVVDHGVGAPWTKSVATRFDDTGIWYAWIDYDGATLSVRASQSSDRPAEADLTRAMDIPSILGRESGYVGFAGASGSGLSSNRILSWTVVPEPSGIGLMFGLGAALAIRRKKRAG